jgi:hypothetical protein
LPESGPEFGDMLVDFTAKLPGGDFLGRADFLAHGGGDGVSLFERQARLLQGPRQNSPQKGDLFRVVARVND